MQVHASCRLWSDNIVHRALVLCVCVCVSKHCHKMKGTKVQTLGARAVAGAGCMAGRLIIMTMGAIIRMRTAN